MVKRSGRRALRDGTPAPAARRRVWTPVCLGAWIRRALRRSEGGSRVGTHVDPATPPTLFTHAPPPRTHARRVRRSRQGTLLPNPGPAGMSGFSISLSSTATAPPPAPLQGSHWPNVSKGGGRIVHVRKESWRGWTSLITCWGGKSNRAAGHSHLHRSWAQWGRGCSWSKSRVLH